MLFLPDNHQNTKPIGVVETFTQNLFVPFAVRYIFVKEIWLSLKRAQPLPFNNCKATVVALTLSSHYMPTDRARELFKHSKDAGSLLVSILKNKEVLDLSFLWVTSQKG